MTARYLVGDVRQQLATLDDGSIDLVLSSPPFLALRSYLSQDDPQKQFEIGSEPTPGAFIDTLLDVVEAITPKLAAHGTLIFELGDTYSGSGGAGGDYNADGLRAGQEKFSGSAIKRRRMGLDENDRPTRAGRGLASAGGRAVRSADVEAGLMQERRRPGPEGRDLLVGWPLDKSLCLIPELFRVALVYGFNPLTGRPTPRWRARNVIRWCRPNPPVGALADKVRPATSDMIVVCKGRRRYFDLDAVRGEPSPNTHARTAQGVGSLERKGKSAERGGNWASLDELAQTAGAPPLDHWWHDDTFDQDAWLIPTELYKGSHYATWPSALLVTPIEAMCPRRVCTTCGKPSERITEASEEHRAHLGSDMFGQRGQRERETKGRAARNGAHPRVKADYVTIGWTECECSAAGGGCRQVAARDRA